MTSVEVATNEKISDRDAVLCMRKWKRCRSIDTSETEKRKIFRTPSTQEEEIQDD